MTRTVSFALFLSLTAVASATAQNAPVPVVSTLADASPAVAPVLQIRSDGLGAYVNKPRYLDSYIDNSVGDWELDLGIVPTKGSGRRAYLAFDQAVPGSGPNGTNPVALPSQQYIVRFVGRCFTQGKNMLQMVAGQQFACPLQFVFNDYNGNQYRVYMNSQTQANTDDVSITCNSVGVDTRCNRWSIRPTGLTLTSDASASRGRLMKLVTVKGKATEVLQGYRQGGPHPVGGGGHSSTGIMQASVEVRMLAPLRFTDQQSESMRGLLRQDPGLSVPRTLAITIR